MHVANSVAAAMATERRGVRIIGTAAPPEQPPPAKNPADYGSGPGEIVIVVGP